MDSLSRLRDSLDSGPTSESGSQAKLLSDFKSAALHLTALYRTSLSSSKDSFREGYIAALNDLLLTLGERRRVSGTAGSSRSHASNRGNRGTRESPEDQLQWFERYLIGRLEAINEENDSGGAEEENAQMEASHDSSSFPRRPAVLRSNSTDARIRASSTSFSQPEVAAEPSSPVPSLAPLQMADLSERPNTRLRTRQQTSSQEPVETRQHPPDQQSPQDVRTSATTSTPSVLTSTSVRPSSGTSAVDAPHALPGEARHQQETFARVPTSPFTFVAMPRQSHASQLTVTRAELHQQPNSPAIAWESAASRGEVIANRPRSDMQDAEMEATLDAQRVLPGSGNRRSAPADAAEMLLSGGLAMLGNGNGPGATPQERKRQRVETEKKTQPWKDQHGGHRRRRDRDRDHRRE
ncbi:hypothetical protein K437DRAFT_254750 [Tilletiaria anomala UBC 951]|uniref:Uncharacterized protein n=1 Tax=Tilletiaria anomala (strain ATCC 24038 / CBS 436.72 / UBC 951) TaxID=1037660 RepID=A0A066WLZ0_TILAU|nr:uncharacterized protein K437DRAFT_254750 [Tilletiaria anomala UBC 951]KDN52014.1 hypothetical protein K437DRAFT_254750 [Tilletiaria anomala UBC 951]